MLPRPSEFPRPEVQPYPSPELLGRCIEKMSDYMNTAENARLTYERLRALELANGYANVYRALKS